MLDLLKLRDDFLLSVALNPIHEWPGPPPGMEGKPSCSYMGEEACRRKCVYRCLMQLSALDYELPVPTPGTGGNEIAAQRGWILEDSVRHWLGTNGINVHEFAGALKGPGDEYFGHGDGWCTWTEDTGQIGGPATKKALLEIKHQNAMRFMDFLKAGIREGAPLYYAQVQALMACGDFKQTLILALSSDPSSVKGDITWAKRGKKYSGELEPNFKMVETSSGVNPFLYVELVLANEPFQRGLLAWAKDINKHVAEGIIPGRGFDVKKAWQCYYQHGLYGDTWCEFHPLCDEHGPCSECSHTGCMETGPEPMARGVTRD